MRTKDAFFIWKCSQTIQDLHLKSPALRAGLDLPLIPQYLPIIPLHLLLSLLQVEVVHKGVPELYIKEIISIEIT